MKRIVILLFLALSASACTEYRANKAFEQMKQEVRDADLAMDGDFLADSAAFRQTNLYHFLERLPKGSDLHLHNGVMLALDDYLQFMEQHPEIVICCKPDSLGYVKVFAEGQAPSGYKPLKDAYLAGVTRQDLKNRLTLKGCPENVRPWDYFAELFGKVANFSKLSSLYEEYLYTAFANYARHGVMHIENRQTFSGTPEQAAEVIRTFKRAQDRVRVEWPEFSIRMILTGLKNPGYEELNLKIYEIGLKANELVKDTLSSCEPFIVGLDFAQEEDLSYPLMAYKSMLQDALTTDPSLQITLHAGESLKPENNEIRSAIELGARRIGHAYNLYLHPELISVVKRKGICLETCPVSNCVLGYCSDLRRHPMRDYIKAGIDVAICDDDPLFQEGVSLVDDYFVAAVYWDLSLSQIKNLCRNSIEHSFLSERGKQSLLRQWQTAWESYCNF